MGKVIQYTPSPRPTDPVADQTADLMSALHETGLLRALTGAVRAYPEMAEMLVGGLDAEKLKALAALAELSDILGAEGAKQFVSGISSAVAAADHVTNQPAPSLLGIMRQLADADVRRGIAAIIAALGAFGRAVAR